MILEGLDCAFGIIGTVAIRWYELAGYTAFLEIRNESLRCGVVSDFMCGD